MKKRVRTSTDSWRWTIKEKLYIKKREWNQWVQKKKRDTDWKIKRGLVQTGSWKNLEIN